MIVFTFSIVSGHIRYTSHPSCRGLARFVGQAAEVHRRTSPRDGRDSGRSEIDFVELAVERERFAVEQRPQDAHNFDASLVARFGVHCLSGQVAGDDVDRKASAKHPIERRQLPRKLRRPHLAAADGDQQADAARERRDAAGERDRIDAQLIARRQQDVVEAAALCRDDDVAAMLVARAQAFVGNAEKFVIVAAQRGKPRDFHAWIGGSNDRRWQCRAHGE